MNNVVEINVEVNGFYKKIKEISKWINIKVVEGNTISNEPFNLQQGKNNIVVINKKIDISERIHWLLGLYMTLCIKQKGLNGKLHVNDMDFIEDALWHKYANEETNNYVAQNQPLADEVLNYIDTWLKEG
ncbi:hypothetical protein D3C81_1160510 [compost metagenome]